jgi:hypothetical protein
MAIHFSFAELVGTDLEAANPFPRRPTEARATISPSMRPGFDVHSRRTSNSEGLAEIVRLRVD